MGGELPADCASEEEWEIPLRRPSRFSQGSIHSFPFRCHAGEAVGFRFKEEL